MEHSARQDWLGLLARADADHLTTLWSEAGHAPTHTLLRAPETGTAMVRGRAGAQGAAFNLGEVTVTRCSLQLDDGTVGHGYVQGRDKTHARHAALIDALMQTDAAEEIERSILAPLRAQRAATATARAQKAAATKVEFFTLARGED